MSFKSFAYKILYRFSSKKEKEKLRIQKKVSELVIYPDFYLIKIGYINSLLKNKIIDENNEPIPWMNYSIVSFLKERLNNYLNVFEYGSGSSTIFFSKRIKKIISVEYDKKWFEQIQNETKNLSNIQLIYTEVNDNYPLTINNFAERFDMVIIDGRKRVKCANAALQRLSAVGVVILDDSDREYYAEIFSLYKSAGFKALKFEGLKPTGFSIEQTTIFYKSENNCLGL